jgi:hypothetical protein
MSNNQAYYKARFEIDTSSTSGLKKEHCRANRDQIENILHRRRHEQVRIEFPRINEITTSAIYTVTAFHDELELVSLGDKIPDMNCKLF